MARYKLKAGSENFQIVDGPDAGKEFMQGKIYETVPSEYADRFVAVAEETAGAAATD